MSEEPSLNVARFLTMRAVDSPRICALKAPIGRTPEGTIRYEERTFAELNLESDQVAHGLTEKGIGAGTRVLLMVKPGSDLIRCCFALFKVGAVPVVIDPGMGLKHFLACVRRTRPEVLMAVPLGQWIGRLFSGSFRSVKDRIPVGRRFPRWYRSFSTVPFQDVKRSSDDLAAILFTSGSTGPPKGVVYGHGQFDAQVTLVRETFSIEPGEVDLPMLPVFALFNPALGMTTVVPEINPGKPASAEPARILQAIEQCSVTNSFGSPVLWKKIGHYLTRTGRQYPSMRRILMAGAPMPPALVRTLHPFFPNARIWSPYGATECLPVSAIEGRTILESTQEKTRQGAGTCVGEAVSGVRIQIIRIAEQAIPSLDEAEILPVGEIGEIIATGPSVTVGYDALPEATERAKIRDLEGHIWHRMGDAGYLDGTGKLWFCGRLVERVLTPAGPVYSDCVEGIINTVPGVGRSALIGLGEPPNQEPAIVIEMEEGERPNREAILEAAGSHPVTRPIREVFFTSSFPVDVRHNAKIHRLELARRYQRK